MRLEISSLDELNEPKNDRDIEKYVILINNSTGNIEVVYTHIPTAFKARRYALLARSNIISINDTRYTITTIAYNKLNKYLQSQSYKPSYIQVVYQQKLPLKFYNE